MALLWIVIAGAAISFILVRSCPALELLHTSVPLTPPAQAWSLGANDVANAVRRSHPFFTFIYLFYLLFILNKSPLHPTQFGTSVGSKVLTLRQAVVIASIVEFLGAFLMGSHVVGTTTPRRPASPLH
jgi:hypothetical protein